ncbi:hypothetical protein Dimus_023752 [Dionaea muscipula]
MVRKKGRNRSLAHDSEDRTKSIDGGLRGEPMMIVSSKEKTSVTFFQPVANTSVGSQSHDSDPAVSGCLGHRKVRGRRGRGKGFVVVKAAAKALLRSRVEVGHTNSMVADEDLEDAEDFVACREGFGLGCRCSR